MAVGDHLFWKFGKSFDEDETLFVEGDTSHDMYIVVEGEVEILKETGGHEEVVATLGGGEFLGEMAVLSGEKRSATARVKAGSKLLVIGKETFLSLLKDSGEVSLKMLKDMVARLKSTTDRLKETVQNLTHRNLLIFVLLKGSLKWPSDRESLAQSLVLKEEELEKIINEMASLGLIEIVQGGIFPGNPAKIIEALHLGEASQRNKL